ncbi:hypothetical protein [Streptomyces meridianus]|uniref:YokE-like PH domain-containing protein n=1 Tax=Streptomyces meridianus TaxID=2938945 RepID=A0ABT0X999_9ACTN|nr:hypothetical protein [Streptomyces meridianus]MCM2579098.1 hypothetical protein [Streptomyces meridianus]
MDFAHEWSGAAATAFMNELGETRGMNKNMHGQVEPHLRPGERLLAVCECGRAPGVPDLPVRLRRPPQESEFERRVKSRLPGAVQRFLQPSEPRAVSRTERVLEGAEQATDDALARGVHGEGLHGGWESRAGQFLVTHCTAARVPASTLAVAFTDRRVLVLADRSKLWQLDPVFEPQWEAPRSAVLGVRANAKGVLQRGRFELVFADGSWIALVASVPTHAEPFAAQVGGA